MHRRESDMEVCRLCERDVPREMITLHHLTPKERGGTAEQRVPLCKPCHKQLHATFSNKDLARTYHSLDSLKGAASLQPFLGWIRKQKPERNFQTVIAAGHPHARRRRRS